jgi:hypothetical protein
LNALFNGMESHFMSDHDLVPDMGSYGPRPSESQPRALRGAGTGMADVLVAAGVHGHHQHSDVTP